LGEREKKNNNTKGEEKRGNTINCVKKRYAYRRAGASPEKIRVARSARL